MSYQHQYIDGTTIHFKVGKAVCVGRNYAEHANELNNPVPIEPILFIKPATSIISSNGGFTIPNDKGAVHYEAEIALLIGKTLSGIVSSNEAHEAIAGFAPALDLTLRDVQTKLKEQGLNSGEMITPIIALIQYIANIFTLQAGDIVLTGTPKGVGALHTGDRIVMELPNHCHFVTEVI